MFRCVQSLRSLTVCIRQNIAQFVTTLIVNEIYFIFSTFELKGCFFEFVTQVNYSRESGQDVTSPKHGKVSSL